MLHFVALNDLIYEDKMNKNEMTGIYGLVVENKIKNEDKNAGDSWTVANAELIASLSNANASIWSYEGM